MAGTDFYKNNEPIPRISPFPFRIGAPAQNLFAGVV